VYYYYWTNLLVAITCTGFVSIPSLCSTQSNKQHVRNSTYIIWECRFKFDIVSSLPQTDHAERFREKYQSRNFGNNHIAPVTSLLFTISCYETPQWSFVVSVVVSTSLLGYHVHCIMYVLARFNPVLAWRSILYWLHWRPFYWWALIVKLQLSIQEFRCGSCCDHVHKQRSRLQPVVLCGKQTLSQTNQNTNNQMLLWFSQFGCISWMCLCDTWYSTP